jgi:DNA topoisomerase-1
VVAGFLGNTPAVARASYIDPRVVDRYQSGWTIMPALDTGDDTYGLQDDRTRRAIEEAVIDLVEEPRASVAVEKVN